MTVFEKRSVVMSLALVLGMTVAALAPIRVLVPGFVDAVQKISDTAGSFGGTLVDDDNFGVSSAGLGDLDGDGNDDVVIGAWFDDTGGADRGAVWVLFLNADGTVSSSQKIATSLGGFGTGLDDGDNFGISIANIGDLDSDGVIDIAVGASNDADGGAMAGAVYILFMNSNGTVKASQKISEGVGGFSGLNPEDFFGRSVVGLGDLDGDSVEDIAVGANGDNTGGDNRGAIWILFLNTDGTVKASQKIDDLVGGFTGVLDDLDGFGTSLAFLGTLDADAVQDIAVGAFADGDGGSSRGAMWVLFLNTDGTVKGFQKISDTAGGFASALADFDSFGRSSGGIGDLDEDGIDDMAVGAPGDDTGGSGRGAVYVLLMNSDGTVKADLKIAHNTNGFGALEDFDQLGISASGIGDLDGDGIEDLVVGTHTDDDGGSGRGAVYVLFLDGTSSLPVELSTFDASVDRDDVLLEWTTLSETNNAGFEVETTVPAGTWRQIGFVDGNGTTDLPQAYSYRAADLDPGVHRFRLKQVDFDGAFEYSHVVEAVIAVPDRLLLRSVYPNPFNTRASISFAVDREQHVDVTLFDAAGRMIGRLFSSTVSANEVQLVPVEATGLTSGAYFVRVEGTGASETARIVLSR